MLKRGYHVVYCDVGDLYGNQEAVKRWNEYYEYLRFEQLFAETAAKDFAQWDVFYWAERLREQKYDIRDEELRPYFPLDRVLDGMFQLVEKLFDIRVRPADGEARVWHEDVRFFAVSGDSSSQ